MEFLDKVENQMQPRSLPRYLYKYYSNIEYVIDAINNHRIHIEAPAGYNDVFDSARVVDESELDYVLCNKNYDMIVAKANRNHQELVTSLLSHCDYELKSIEDVCKYLLQGGVPYDSIQNIKFHICKELKNGQPCNNKIACFTSRKDSLLMWAHYGNHLKGACLCFDTQKDLPLFRHAYAVEYTKNRNRERNYNFYFCKAAEWKYEKEWRIVAQTKEEYISTQSCVGIVIGERASHTVIQDLKINVHEFPLSDYLKLAYFANEAGLKVYKAVSNHSKYKIDIIRRI